MRRKQPARDLNLQPMPPNPLSIETLWAWASDHDPLSPPGIAAHVAVAEAEAFELDLSSVQGIAEQLLHREVGAEAEANTYRAAGPH